MSKIEIFGGKELNGIIEVSGAKNATLPLMTATILSEETVKLSRVPNLRDVHSLIDLLRDLGANAEYNSETKELEVNASKINNYTASYELVSKMRASVLVLGPLLARFGEAKVSLPGGCAIGTRPVDIHLSGFEALGAKIELEDGYIVAKAPKDGLVGGKFHLKMPSVGATENIMMAATLAKGTTILTNVAKEPEIVDLGECLNKMGADIKGLGTDTLTIKGVNSLNGTTHEIIADRIEAGTFILASAMNECNVKIKGANVEHIEALIEPLTMAGIDLTHKEDIISLNKRNSSIRGIDVITEPYPGFPTDMQAQMMTMLTLAEGASMITETVFENRFMHVPELVRMGANINIHGSSALVRGVTQLKGADVMATDLRASASLVMAGLVAKGKTTVHEIKHLERGYENIVEKLTKIGAELRKID